jgi:hypothetical protein
MFHIGSTAILGAHGAYAEKNFFFATASMWTLDRLSSFVKTTRSEEENRKKRILRFVFDQPWSKGDQETFRRGALVRAETPKAGNKEERPKSWCARRAYHLHPYFSDNLRYAP